MEVGSAGLLLGVVLVGSGSGGTGGASLFTDGVRLLARLDLLPKENEMVRPERSPGRPSIMRAGSPGALMFLGRAAGRPSAGAPGWPSVLELEVGSVGKERASVEGEGGMMVKLWSGDESGSGWCWLVFGVDRALM